MVNSPARPDRCDAYASFSASRTPGRTVPANTVRHFSAAPARFSLPELVWSAGQFSPQMPPRVYGLRLAPAHISPGIRSETPRSAALRCKEKHILFCASPEPPFLFLHHFAIPKKSPDSIIAYFAWNFQSCFCVFWGVKYAKSAVQKPLHERFLYANTKNSYFSLACLVFPYGSAHA